MGSRYLPGGVRWRGLWFLGAFALIAATEFALWRWFTGHLGVVFGGIFGLAGVASATLWWWMYRRSPEHLIALEVADQDSRRTNSLELQGSLRRLGVDQAASQIGQLTKKLHAYSDVLQMRFSDEPVIMDQYMNAALHLHQSAYRNLESVAAMAKSVESIDMPRIKQRLDALQEQGKTDSSEVDTLHEREAMYLLQQQRIDELVMKNEKALTALSDAATTVSNIDAQRVRTTDTHAVIENMKRVAEQIESQDEETNS
ncbi:MAG: hypothetical protein OER96_01860 [Gammaproteobacteria bacterium]|nr:hypothetical protein [Gammaproteobacteria bacterium]